MERELRDELEVPGHVVGIQLLSRKDITKRLNEIMDKWQQKGWNTPNDVPESKEKEEYERLLRKVGIHIKI